MGYSTPDNGINGKEYRHWRYKIQLHKNDTHKWKNVSWCISWLKGLRKN